MKKSGEFVSKGLPAQSAPEEVFDADAPAPLSSLLHPADLPRDYGMAGEVGAYEVKALAGALTRSLDALTQNLTAAEDADALVVAALDRLMSPAERHRLAVESVADGVVTLSLARKSDRFLYNRTIVPKLKVALAAQLGPVRIQLTDRMR